MSQRLLVRCLFWYPKGEGDATRAKKKAETAFKRCFAVQTKTVIEVEGYPSLSHMPQDRIHVLVVFGDRPVPEEMQKQAFAFARTALEDAFGNKYSVDIYPLGDQVFSGRSLAAA